MGKSYRWGNSPIMGKNRNENIYSYIQQGLSTQIPGREARSNHLSNLYDTALQDPAGQANKFKGLYGEAAAAYNAPLFRDFQNTIGGVAGNVAARFGGNASSEELRQVQQSGDAFSRNATEANARMGGQAVTAGQSYTNELGAAAGQAQDRQDELSRMILTGLMGQDPAKRKKSLVGGLLGVGGAIVGGIAGGPAGAGVGFSAGSNLGNNI